MENYRIYLVNNYLYLWKLTNKIRWLEESKKELVEQISKIDVRYSNVRKRKILLAQTYLFEGIEKKQIHLIDKAEEIFVGDGQYIRKIENNYKNLLLVKATAQQGQGQDKLYQNFMRMHYHGKDSPSYKEPEPEQLIKYRELTKPILKYLILLERIKLNRAIIEKDNIAIQDSVKSLKNSISKIWKDCDAVFYMETLSDIIKSMQFLREDDGIIYLLQDMRKLVSPSDVGIYYFNQFVKSINVFKPNFFDKDFLQNRSFDDFVIEWILLRKFLMRFSTYSNSKN